MVLSIGIPAFHAGESWFFIPRAQVPRAQVPRAQVPRAQVPEFHTKMIVHNVTIAGHYVPQVYTLSVKTIRQVHHQAFIGLYFLRLKVYLPVLIRKITVIRTQIKKVKCSF